MNINFPLAFRTASHFVPKFNAKYCTLGVATFILGQITSSAARPLSHVFTYVGAGLTAFQIACWLFHSRVGGKGTSGESASQPSTFYFGASLRDVSYSASGGNSQPCARRDENFELMHPVSQQRTTSPTSSFQVGPGTRRQMPMNEAPSAASGVKPNPSGATTSERKQPTVMFPVRQHRGGAAAFQAPTTLPPADRSQEGRDVQEELHRRVFSAVGLVSAGTMNRQQQGTQRTTWDQATEGAATSTSSQRRTTAWDALQGANGNPPQLRRPLEQPGCLPDPAASAAAPAASSREQMRAVPQSRGSSTQGEPGAPVTAAATGSTRETLTCASPGSGDGKSDGSMKPVSQSRN